MAVEYTNLPTLLAAPMTTIDPTFTGTDDVYGFMCKYYHVGLRVLWSNNEFMRQVEQNVWNILDRINHGINVPGNDADSYRRAYHAVERACFTDEEKALEILRRISRKSQLDALDPFQMYNTKRIVAWVKSTLRVAVTIIVILTCLHASIKTFDTNAKAGVASLTEVIGNFVNQIPIIPRIYGLSTEMKTSPSLTADHGTGDTTPPSCILYSDYKNLRYYLVPEQVYALYAMQYCRNHLNVNLAHIEATDVKEFVKEFATSVSAKSFWVQMYRGLSLDHGLFVVDSGDTRVDHMGRASFMCATELGNA